MGEFDLIKRYFQPQILVDDSVQLSIGDDCALVSMPANYQLAITTDTMVENTHFLPTISPEDLAYKAVATNLSDLAAMGAQPKWVSLALTLPNADQNWISAFSQSLLHTLKQYNVTLNWWRYHKRQLIYHDYGTRFCRKNVKGFVGIKASSW